MQERVINMNDITEFMSWFISQVVDMFGELFSILDSITFAGTSLLRVLLTIMIFGSLLGVILTISKSFNVVASKSEKVKDKRSDNSDDGGSKWI